MRYLIQIFIIILLIGSNISVAEEKLSEEETIKNFFSKPLDPEILKARKKNIIVKDGRLVKVIFPDESSRVPGLKEFLDKLKKVVEAKNLSELKTMVHPNVNCGNDYPEEPFNRIDHCVKESVFGYIKSYLNFGGCFYGPYGRADSYMIPSYIACFSQKDFPETASKNDYWRLAFVLKNIKMYAKPSYSSTASSLSTGAAISNEQYISYDPETKKELSESWYQFTRVSDGTTGYIGDNELDSIFRSGMDERGIHITYDFQQKKWLIRDL